MPLIGLWGAISYLPLLGRRQFGSEQFVPVTHGLNSVEFDFNGVSDVKRARRFALIWKNKYMVNERNFSESATFEYENWHLWRVTNMELPQNRKPRYQGGIEGRDAMIELTMENQSLNDGTKLSAIQKQHQEERQKWEKQKQTLSNEVQALCYNATLERTMLEDREKRIKRLEEEYAKEKEEAASYYVKLESQASEIKRLAKNLENQKLANDDLSKELHNLKRKKAQAQSSHWLRGVDLRRLTKLEKANADLNATPEEEKGKRVRSNDEVTRLRRKVKKEVRAYHEECIGLKKTIDELVEEVERLSQMDTVSKVKRLQVQYLVDQIQQNMPISKWIRDRAIEMKKKVMPYSPNEHEMIAFLKEVIDKSGRMFDFFIQVKEFNGI